MCEYCQKGFIDKSGVNIWFAVKPNIDEMVLIFDNCGYQTQSTVKINYCPMCGRKLSEVAE